jgi:hypothetical protein
VSTEQVIIVAVALTVAVLALTGAIVLWQKLARTGAGLRAAQARLDSGKVSVPTQLVEVRSQLAAGDVQMERLLWQLGALDERIDRATSDLVATRAASGRLRVRLIEGRLTIARLRQLVRLAMRLGELRRAFL